MSRLKYICPLHAVVNLLEILHAFLHFQTISFWNTIRVSNSLDLDQAKCTARAAGHDLDPNCLQGLSIEDTSKHRVKPLLPTVRAQLEPSVTGELKVNW